MWDPLADTLPFRFARAWRAWRAERAGVTAGHFRWICTGCGVGGAKPTHDAARGDADAHAAAHDFQFRYGFERAGSW